jgi:hypothetical protein
MSLLLILAVWPAMGCSKRAPEEPLKSQPSSPGKAILSLERSSGHTDVGESVVFEDGRYEQRIAPISSAALKAGNKPPLLPNGRLVACGVLTASELAAVRARKAEGKPVGLGTDVQDNGPGFVFSVARYTTKAHERSLMSDGHTRHGNELGILCREELDTARDWVTKQVAPTMSLATCSRNEVGTNYGFRLKLGEADYELTCGEPLSPALRDLWTRLGEIVGEPL